MTGPEDAGMIGTSRTAMVDRLRAEGVDVVRLLYADLLGVPRSKDVPLSELDRVAHAGLGFCQGVFLTAYDGGVMDGPGGPADGLPDLVVRPVDGTDRVLPWEPGVAVCLADTFDVHTGERTEVGPRNVLLRLVQRFREHGLTPVVGPELEFYLCKRAASGQWERALDRTGRVYMNGALVDPSGLLLQMTRDLAALRLGVFAANHEFSPGQYEINVWHSDAVDAADRCFLLKTAVKEIAHRAGLNATFMGRPWNDEGGSGFHLHVSVEDDDGANACHDPDAASGLSELALHMVGGILAHAPALSALGNPTVNAFKRLGPDTLAPYRVNWGLDNRTCMVRIPPERGSGTRLELRVGDGAANPYVAMAGVLAAALDGIENKLEPPEALEGWSYALPDDLAGPALPTSLPAALDALDRSERMRELLGSPFVDTFLTLKRHEVARFERWVTDWEITEYLEHT